MNVKNDNSTVFQPFPSSCPSYAYKYLICQMTDYHRLETFVANSFINLFFEPNYLDLYEEDYWFQNLSVFTVKSFRIYASNVQPDYSKFMEFIYDQLNNGFFAITHWDRFFLPGSDCYYKNHFDEEHIILSLNEKDGAIKAYSASMGTEREYSVSPDIYFCSNLVFSKFYSNFQFVKFNPNNVSELKTEKIRDDIRDFLKSSNRFYNNPDSKRVYGIEAIKTYISILSSSLSADNKDIVLQTNIICDHILSTMIRIRKLSSSGVIDNQLCKKYRKIDNIRNDITKYTKAVISEYSDSNKKIIIELLSEFCLHEEIVLKEVLSNIDDFLGR